MSVRKACKSHLVPNNKHIFSFHFLRPGNILESFNFIGPTKVGCQRYIFSRRRAWPLLLVVECINVKVSESGGGGGGGGGATLSPRTLSLSLSLIQHPPLCLGLLKAHRTTKNRYILRDFEAFREEILFLKQRVRVFWRGGWTTWPVASTQDMWQSPSSCINFIMSHIVPLS